MRLTKHTDYALRVLMYAAAFPERLVSTEEISEAYGISTHHLLKVVNLLGRIGLAEVRRGRQGGLRLARAPETITLGEVVRRTEADFHMVECFDGRTNTCPIVKVCGLVSPIAEAREAFLRTLDGYSLADVLEARSSTVELRKTFERLGPS